MKKRKTDEEKFETPDDNMKKGEKGYFEKVMIN